MEKEASFDWGLSHCAQAQSLSAPCHADVDERADVEKEECADVESVQTGQECSNPFYYTVLVVPVLLYQAKAHFAA